MKKLIALLLFAVCLVTCFTGCKGTKDNPGNKATATAKATSSPKTSPSSSAPANTEISTALPEETFIVSFSPDPSALASPTAPVSPTPTPVPTPIPTIRPAQQDSICPPALITTGYTTPLDPASVKFPANYNMPYYIEVDVTNQCVNIFRKNPDTGAYDILLNRFVCSGGTSKQPTKTGNFFIKTNEQQMAATGQSVKYTRYYFKKYTSYAYYVTRYSNEYMFHSFTFGISGGKIVPKSGAYYNMGNTGSAGCLRMLMGHAKWIYENIDGGTYCVVNKSRARDNNLRSVLKKYVPPLGWDMTPAWNGDRSNYGGLVQCDFVANPEKADKVPITPPPATPTPTPTPTPTLEPTPVVTPTVTTPIVSATPDTSDGPTLDPAVTPNVTPDATPDQPTVTTAPPVVTPTVTSPPTATPDNTDPPTPDNTDPPTPMP